MEPLSTEIVEEDHHQSSLSPVQFWAKVVVLSVSSLLSLAGSISIMLFCRSKLRHRFYHRLLFVLSCCDFCCAIAFLCQPWLVPSRQESGGDGATFGWGTPVTCSVLGFIFTNCAMAVACLNAALSYYFQLTIVQGKPEDFIVQRYETMWYVSSAALPLCFSILGVSLQGMNPDDYLQICTLEGESDNDNDHRGLIVGYAYTAVLFGLGLVGFVSTYQVYEKVRNRSRFMKRYSFDHDYAQEQLQLQQQRNPQHQQNQPQSSQSQPNIHQSQRSLNSVSNDLRVTDKVASAGAEEEIPLPNTQSVSSQSQNSQSQLFNSVSTISLGLAEAEKAAEGQQIVAATRTPTPTTTSQTTSSDPPQPSPTIASEKTGVETQQQQQQRPTSIITSPAPPQTSIRPSMIIPGTSTISAHKRRSFRPSMLFMGGTPSVVGIQQQKQQNTDGGSGRRQSTTPSTSTSRRRGPSSFSLRAWQQQQQQQQQQAASSARVQMVATQAALYSMANLNSILWPIVRVLVGGVLQKQSGQWYWLDFLCFALYPLQGFLNCFVYLRPTYIQWRKIYPQQSHTWTMYQILIVPENTTTTTTGGAMGGAGGNSQRRRVSVSTGSAGSSRIFVPKSVQQQRTYGRQGSSTNTNWSAGAGAAISNNSRRKSTSLNQIAIAEADLGEEEDDSDDSDDSAIPVQPRPKHHRPSEKNSIINSAAGDNDCKVPHRPSNNLQHNDQDVNDQDDDIDIAYSSQFLTMEEVDEEDLIDDTDYDDNGDMDKQSLKNYPSSPLVGSTRTSSFRHSDSALSSTTSSLGPTTTTMEENRVSSQESQREGGHAAVTRRFSIRSRRSHRASLRRSDPSVSSTSSLGPTTTITMDDPSNGFPESDAARDTRTSLILHDLGGGPSPYLRSRLSSMSVSAFFDLDLVDPESAAAEQEDDDGYHRHHDDNDEEANNNNNSIDNMSISSIQEHQPQHHGRISPNGSQRSKNSNYVRNSSSTSSSGKLGPRSPSQRSSRQHRNSRGLSSSSQRHYSNYSSGSSRRGQASSRTSSSNNSSFFSLGNWSNLWSTSEANDEEEPSESQGGPPNDDLPDEDDPPNKIDDDVDEDLPLQLKKMQSIKLGTKLPRLEEVGSHHFPDGSPQSGIVQVDSTFSCDSHIPEPISCTTTFGNAATAAPLPEVGLSQNEDNYDPPPGDEQEELKVALEKSIAELEHENFLEQDEESIRQANPDHYQQQHSWHGDNSSAGAIALESTPRVEAAAVALEADVDSGIPIQLGPAQSPSRASQKEPKEWNDSVAVVVLEENEDEVPVKTYNTSLGESQMIIDA